MRPLHHHIDAGLAVRVRTRIIERLETLSRALAQDNLDSFSDNLRFIETRYGGSDPLS